MRKLLFPLLAGMMMAAMAADTVRLETENTVMAFRLDGKTWLLDHYGRKGVPSADAALLAFQSELVRDDDGNRKPATLSVFGADTFDFNPNRYGGLAVTHADGVVSTELEAAELKEAVDAEGSKSLVFTLKDPAYDFTVRQHFRSRPDCDVIETWLEISHQESGPVRLSRMDSVALTFPLAAAGSPKLLTLSGRWASEGDLSIAEIPRGKTVTARSRTGVRDAWAANAAFMLWSDAAVDERSGEVLGGVLCWSGSHHVTVEHSVVDALELRFGVENPAGDYVLEPGRVLKTPMAALTWSRRGRGQISRNLHRWARNHRLPHGRELRDVLLNSWEGSYFSFTEATLLKMMDGVREMGGELFVLDDGWFGQGEFARDNRHQDTVGLGDWVVNPEKLPRGLDFLQREAAQRGLGFGFWVEPEMVNSRSRMATEHPDWLLQEPTRRARFGRGGTQTVLDLANPAVRDHLLGQLDALLKSTPGTRYIKWDANANFLNFGCRSLPADRQANLWFDYTAGLYELLARLQAKYPALVIQACSSGGGHMDYGFLGYADEFWTSDDTDPRERVLIQWGASQFYPASAMAAHVTASPNHQTQRETPFKFRFDVAMSGRLGFELHPENLTAEEVAFAKTAVATYKRLRPVVQQGELYRLQSPYEGDCDHAALQYVGDDRARAVVYVYALTRRCRPSAVKVRLDGLDPKRNYRVRELNRWGKDPAHVTVDDQTLSGAALQELGLFVQLRRDYDSCVLELEAVGPVCD